MIERYLMECGHVNNTTRINDDGTKQPWCVICDCGEVVKAVEDTEGLQGRKAKCSHHKFGCAGGFTDSKWSLPFFEHRPNEPYDRYYCGCWGWD